MGTKGVKGGHKEEIQRHQARSVLLPYFTYLPKQILQYLPKSILQLKAGFSSVCKQHGCVPAVPDPSRRNLVNGTRQYFLGGIPGNLRKPFQSGLSGMYARDVFTQT